MNTTQAFLDALTQPSIRKQYLDSTIRTWRSRANRELLSLDFMMDFLLKNGYHLKQVMLWQKPEQIGEPFEALSHNNHHVLNHHHEESTTDKTELGKKIYEVRKQMSKELLNRWFNWSKNEYTTDFPERKTNLTEAVFAQMTYGRYISRDNIVFALKVLKEGKRMVSEFDDHVKKELNDL